jgi:Ran GTPase-activating protein (RanGAP) involved in mRNA processing and transport
MCLFSIVQIDLSQRGLQASDARLVKMALLQNSGLVALKLGYNNLCDEGVIILASGVATHKSLEALDLGFNNFGDVGCTALANALDKSRTINGRNNGNGLGTLETLFVAGNVIGEAGALAISKVIWKGCSLKRLNITGNRLGPDGVKALTEAVTEDEIRRRNQDNIHSETNHNAPTNHEHDEKSAGGVQELYLAGTSMGMGGCKAVSRLLSNTTLIRVLSLADCGIGDDDLVTLATGVKANRERLLLESLQLSFNNITSRGLESLMNSIWGSQTLKELRLDNNQIGDRGAHHVAAILPYVKTLELVDVGFNSIKSQGMRTLMKVVAETQHLLSLSVSGNPIDTNAAKAVAYALAYNGSLKSLYVVHCSVDREGQRHIAAGVVSNSRTALRKLFGFSLGRKSMFGDVGSWHGQSQSNSRLIAALFLLTAVIVTIGFPSPLEHWTNSQVLNFVRMMWDKAKQDEPTEEDQLDPLHFLQGDALSPSQAIQKFSGRPLQAAVVVEVAKQAFNALVEDGVDVFSRRASSHVSFDSPLADEFMVEDINGTLSKSTTISEANQDDDNEDVLIASNQTRSFVADPEPPLKVDLPDPNRRGRIVEWLCTNMRHLNELGQLPFNSSELWRLHQHYFTPVVNESGGRVVPSSEDDSVEESRIVFSVPEVSRGTSKHSGSSSHSAQLSEDHLMMIPISDPTLPASPLGPTSLPLLKRKVSYRFLGDAELFSQPRFATIHHAPKHHHQQLASVSKMIEEGPTVPSMPRKTKRARRNRTRISFVPRIKAKLDSYLDVCHEKALATMRQLYFVEQALLSGNINPIDPATTPRTHLCGVLATEAEMILIDML